jgi:multicomponent Na+:H+ antiporter subunit E
MPRRSRRLLFSLREHGLHVAVAYVIWICCTGLRDPADRWAGLVAACCFAAVAAFVLPMHERFRLRALPGFAFFFMVQSCRAAVHVAGLALRPGLRLAPFHLCLRSRLPPGAPRAVFANLVSLLPGSLSANLVDDTHHLHVLHPHEGLEEELRVMEGQVARLFGVEAEDPA